MCISDSMRYNVVAAECHKKKMDIYKLVNYIVRRPTEYTQGGSSAASEV